MNTNASKANYRLPLMLIIGALLLSYLAVCGLLYAYQRDFIFQRELVFLGAPPADSVYRSLSVDVPGLGQLQNWVVDPVQKGLPTVVFFHGNNMDRRDFLDMGARFHQRGWGVVLASYRGYSGNPGIPSEAGLLADARATLAALDRTSGPIIVWGHSLGSGVAARMASEGRASALVLESPYTSIPDQGQSAYPALKFFPLHLLCTDKFDTASLIARIKVPALIIHAKEDPEIAYAMGSQLAALFAGRAYMAPLPELGNADGLYTSHFPHHLVDLSGIVDQWTRKTGMVQ